MPSGDGFGGVDISHTFLDARVPKLLSKELTEHSLALQVQEGCGRGLVTLRPLHEAGDFQNLDHVQMTRANIEGLMTFSWCAGRKDCCSNIRKVQLHEHFAAVAAAAWSLSFGRRCPGHRWCHFR